MALIKTDSSIIEIYGRFGGVYFKRGKDGQHVQAMPRIRKYTRSPAQIGSWGEGSPFAAGGISGFSGGALIWLAALVISYAALWALFALTYLFTTKRGGKKHITGYNWFQHYTLAYPDAERPPLWKPPPSPSSLPPLMAVYKDMWTYHHAPEDWPNESPSAYYYVDETYNDRVFYTSDDYNWRIWWKDPMWVLSPGTGWEPAGMTFYSPGDLITDYYTNPVTGSKTHIYLGRPPD